MTSRLSGRIALITGASRGIGAAVAQRFAAEGAHVILVARTAGGLEAVGEQIRADAEAGGVAALVPLDLTNFDNIDQLGARIFERFGRLDVLVGNAGVLGTLSPMGHIDPPVWDRVMALNVTANWRLIRSFDPLLRQSAAGRAIFVTSGIARKAFPYWGAYGTSKAALETMARVYASEVAKTPLRVNLLDPGQVRTALHTEAVPERDPSTLKPPEAVTEAFVALAEPACTLNGEVLKASELASWCDWRPPSQVGLVT